MASIMFDTGRQSHRIHLEKADIITVNKKGKIIRTLKPKKIKSSLNKYEFISRKMNERK